MLAAFRLKRRLSGDKAAAHEGRCWLAKAFGIPTWAKKPSALEFDNLRVFFIGVSRKNSLFKEPAVKTPLGHRVSAQAVLAVNPAKFSLFLQHSLSLLLFYVISGNH